MTAFIAHSCRTVAWRRLLTLARMRVSGTPIRRFASGVPSADIGFRVFVGRFMGTGTRVGTPIHRRYAPMFSICSKTRRVKAEDIGTPVVGFRQGEMVTVGEVDWAPV